jgi:hypothetical protein
MAGLVPAFDVWGLQQKHGPGASNTTAPVTDGPADVNARHKAGHDGAGPM